MSDLEKPWNYHYELAIPGMTPTSWTWRLLTTKRLTGLSLALLTGKVPAH